MLCLRSKLIRNVKLLVWYFMVHLPTPSPWPSTLTWAQPFSNRSDQYFVSPDFLGDITTSFVRRDTDTQLHNCRGQSRVQYRTQISLLSPLLCKHKHQLLMLRINVGHRNCSKILSWIIQPPERCWSVEFLFMPELNTGQSHQENCIKLNCQTMTAGWHIFVASSTEIGIEQI